MDEAAAVTTGEGFTAMETEALDEQPDEASVAVTVYVVFAVGETDALLTAPRLLSQA